MAKQLNFYMDDSGTRHPDRKIGRSPAHGCDWFALGGILIHEEDEYDARSLHEKFVTRWNITAPLHSSEIRAKSDNFSFIGRLSESDEYRFYEELYVLLRDMPVIGHACVIDRPNYNKRYKEKYKLDRWTLCKTAFTIAVERAAKYASLEGRKLNIYPERSSKADDDLLKEYFQGMKSTGMPFDDKRSSKYQPAGSDLLSNTLYDLKFKYKSSPLVQIADLYLWPICMGGYDKSNRPYARLMGDGKLIDRHLSKEQCAELGIKYSCFD